MTKPMVRIHDLQTDKVIDREMTDQEFASYQETLDSQELKKTQIEAKAQAKATAEGKLAALGLTTDDLRALGL